MRYVAVVASALFLFGTSSAVAQEVDSGDVGVEPVALESKISSVEIGNGKTFGLGVLVGDPNGLSGKRYLGGRYHAVDMALAYRLWGTFGSSYYAHGTYLVHPNEFVELDGVVLSWHTGIGGFVNLAAVNDMNEGTETLFFGGARVPIGLDVDVEKVPIQMFIDVSLNVGLIPSTQLDAQGTLGFRYYFL